MNAHDPHETSMLCLACGTMQPLVMHDGQRVLANHLHQGVRCSGSGTSENLPATRDDDDGDVIDDDGDVIDDDSGDFGHADEEDDD